MKAIKYTVVLALLALAAPCHADLILKKSTASQAVKFGPFVSSTDGNAEQTALTIANTDIKCSKNGGAFASKNSGGGTHDANGMYTVTFDATDTNTAGRFQCFVHVTGALPVYQEFNVVEGAIYDGLYNTNSGTSTTILPVNTIQLSGTTQTARDLGASVLLSNGTGTGQLSITSGVVNANQVQLAGTSITTLTGAYPSLGIVESGTAQAVTGTTLQLRSAANFDNDNEIVGATCLITSATTGAGQARTVTAYTNSTDTATVATWTTTPTGAITYVCFGTASASSIATDVWASGARTLTAATNITSTGGTVTVSAGAVTVGTNNDKTGYGLAANAVDSTSVAATGASKIATSVATTQGILTGTCSSGSTTTCVDAALTQAAASQLQDRLMCFSDSWCGLITTFNTATHTTTTTKVAPSTRSSLTYTIFPSTQQ